MSSASGRYTITFNGEIYNFKRLRRVLEDHGARFRGGSDTEVMLAAIEKWGPVEAVRRFVGMFAFGLWDQTERQLHLFRDRCGVKPLYYGWTCEGFAFGSELKALQGVAGDGFRISADAVDEYFAWGYVPSPYSVFDGIYKLPAGSCLTLSAADLALRPHRFSPTLDGDRAAPQSYWKLDGCIASTRITGESEALHRLEQILADAVRIRMVSDVPLGVFLSGGIDSSLVLALMQRLSSSPVRSFSIGFNESEYDEAAYAREVARHLGSEHTEYRLSPAEAQEIIPRLPTMFDEPFADASQIPTYLLAKLTRQQVTVALSGDGGDELFGGYHRYQAAQTLWSQLGRLPLWARHIFQSCAGAVPRVLLQILRPLLKSVAPDWLGNERLPIRVNRVADIWDMSSNASLFLSLHQVWSKHSRIFEGVRVPESIRGCYEEYLFIDTQNYLPDDILVKVDRASMAVGLEVREPFLDHRVVALAWGLHPRLRGFRSSPKKILRDLLGRYLPANLFMRPKMGFSIPLDDWLRGPLRVWAEDLLLGSDGCAHEIRALCDVGEVWRRHQSRQRDYGHKLWVLLMLKAWYRHFRSGASQGM